MVSCKPQLCIIAVKPTTCTRDLFLLQFVSLFVTCFLIRGELWIPTLQFHDELHNLSKGPVSCTIIVLVSSQFLIHEELWTLTLHYYCKAHSLNNLIRHLFLVPFMSSFLSFLDLWNPTPHDLGRVHKLNKRLFLTPPLSLNMWSWSSNSTK